MKRRFNAAQTENKSQTEHDYSMANENSMESPSLTGPGSCILKRVEEKYTEYLTQYEKEWECRDKREAWVSLEIDNRKVYLKSMIYRI